MLAAEESERVHYCDVCERLVGGDLEYREHLSQHATCGIDGCGYTAHQDLLEKHIRHQHLTGFYKRIVQGNSPQDVEKWREERRKNWPTRIKIAEKIVEKEALRERGEVMNLKREKRPRWETAPAEAGPETEWACNCRARHFLEAGRGRGRRNPARIPRNIRHQPHCAELENIRQRVREKREKREEKFRERTAGKKMTQTEDSDRSQPAKKRRRLGEDKADSESEDETCNGGLRMFQGTLNMMKERERRLVERSEASVPPTLSCVDLVSYQDQQSDDDEAPTEVKTVVSYENIVVEEKTSEESPAPLVKKSRKKKKKTLQVSDPTSSNPPIPGEEDQEPDIETENIVEEVEEVQEGPETSEGKTEEIPEKLPAAAETEKLPAVFRKRLRQPTLLEKLLLSEIKKERNTILQCVRYVCKNNFFQQ